MERPSRAAAVALTGALLAACQSPAGSSSAGSPEPLDLAALLETRPDRFADVLENADVHRLKIELAVVHEDGPDGPRLVRSSLDLGPEYFYPASSVKTCAVIAALDAMRDLETVPGVTEDRTSPLRFHPLFEGESLETLGPDGMPLTMVRDVARVMLVSDNAAYNRLYEFAGAGRIRTALAAAGLDEARVVHRLSEFRSPEDQLRYPSIDVGRGAVLPRREEALADFERARPVDGVILGTARLEGGEVREGPMDFTRKNWMPLRELLDMNVALLRPDLAAKALPVHPDDRDFIARAMASTPADWSSEETGPIPYDRAKYPDDYSKFLAPGLWRLRDRGEVVIRDKVGRAYGFSITNSHVVDRVTGRSFFLAATIYTNANGVVGDGVYEYERADRFLGDLGEAVGEAVFGASRQPRCRDAGVGLSRASWGP